MSIRRLLLPSLSMIVLSCAALTAEAQNNGPINGPKKGDNGPKQAPVAANELTPERVVDLLKAKGAQTKVEVVPIPNGQKTNITAQLQTNDFGYEFTFTIITANNGYKAWYISANLNPNGNAMAKEKLQALMQFNFNVGDSMFALNPQTGVLVYQTQRYGMQVNDQYVGQVLNNYLADIKSTANMWQ